MAALALAVLVGPWPADAQPRAGARAAVERTSHELARASRVVQGSAAPEARDLLGQAEELQRRAERALAAGLGEEALRLTHAARRRGGEALEAAGRPGRPGFPPRLVKRTGRLLAQIAPMVRACASPEADRLLAEALGEHEEAERALQDRRPGAAIEHSARARRQAMAALRRAEEVCEAGPGHAELAVERTRALLDASAWLREAPGEPGELYGRAAELWESARAELDAGRPRQALRRTQAARARLVEALDRAERPLAPPAVADAVRRSRERLEEAGGRTLTRPQRRALQVAAARQRRAERLLERGRLPAALGEIGAVRDLLDRAGL